MTSFDSFDQFWGRGEKKAKNVGGGQIFLYKKFELSKFFIKNFSKLLHNRKDLKKFQRLKFIRKYWNRTKKWPENKKKTQNGANDVIFSETDSVFTLFLNSTAKKRISVYCRGLCPKRISALKGSYWYVIYEGLNGFCIQQWTNTCKNEHVFAAGVSAWREFQPLSEVIDFIYSDTDWFFTFNCEQTHVYYMGLCLKRISLPSGKAIDLVYESIDWLFTVNSTVNKLAFTKEVSLPQENFFAFR